MEWELRIVLAVIGALIIGFVAFDGWRRSQKNRQTRADLPTVPDEDFSRSRRF